MNPDLPQLPKPTRHRGTLTANIRLTETTHHLVFQAPVEFRYASGQFVSFHHPDEDGGEPLKRSYSMANPAYEGGFEVCLNRVPHGPFSNLLCDLEPGAELTFEGPYGFFVPRIAPRDSLFVATGTGVGPVRSILLEMLQRPERRQMTLLFGTRHEGTILYHDEWQELARVHPNFRLLPTLSRPSSSWTGLVGHVQAHLGEFLSNREMNVYICGLKHMVEDVRGRFKTAGFDRRSIVYERFD
jgi:ferredoxin-NADP reductase